MSLDSVPLFKIPIPLENPFKNLTAQQDEAFRALKKRHWKLEGNFNKSEVIKSPRVQNQSQVITERSYKADESLAPFARTDSMYAAKE
jgi:hypothetical protein